MAVGTAAAIKLEGAGSDVQRVWYPLALLASLSLWLLALPAPLWLDETLAYWQISGGFSHIWSRSAAMPSSFAYLYVLWIAKSFLGSSEIALRIPSLIAMIGAVYCLFRAAREIFNEEIAFISCILFSLQLHVVFAATDARPYAFALLATNTSIFMFVRWILRRELRDAVLFGAAVSGIFYFHYVFGIAVLPAFAVCYLVAGARSIKEDLRQLKAMSLSFVLVFLPQSIRFTELFRSRQAHSFGGAPEALLVLGTLAPLKPLVVFVAAVFVGALLRKIRLPDRECFPAALFPPILALVPAAILYTSSAATSVHLFIPRYCLAAVPGASLTWAWMFSRIDSRVLRQIVCTGLVAVTVFLTVRSPLSRQHELNFKETHAFVNANTAHDKAPVLICSGFIESNFRSMSSANTNEDPLLSQISYYPVQTSAVLLPLGLNEEAIRIGSRFVLDADERHERFLVIVPPLSYPTLQWLATYSSGTFRVREIKHFDGVLVVEFVPYS